MIRKGRRDLSQASSVWPHRRRTLNDLPCLKSIFATEPVDAGAITHTNLADVESGEGIELHDICVHVLPAGAHYSLTRRKPLVLEGKTGRG
jgi:hypothetical protein